jgi:hypothetical protein
MSVIRRPDAVTEFDLDATVEIPVPDFSDTVTTNALDATVATRALTSLDLSGGTDVHPVPAEAGQIVRELGVAEERLARNADRLNVLELELESAQAAEQQLRESMEREIAAVRESAHLQSEVAREEARRSIQQSQAELLKTRQDAATQAGVVHAQEARIAELSARSESLERELTQLRTDLDAERRAAAVAREQAAAQGAGQGQLQRELAEVRAMNERHLEVLRSVEGYRAVHAGLQYDAEAQVARLEQDAALAAQALAERDRRIAALEQQLTRGGEAIVGHTVQLSQVSAERDTLAARVAALEAAQTEAQAQHAQMVSDEREVLARLQTEHAGLEGQLEEKDQDLRAAEDEIQRLERELAAAASSLADLQQSSQALTAKIAERDEEYRQLEAQTRNNAETLANLHQTIQRLGREEPRPAQPAPAVPLENMTRLLVREQDGVEHVHALGRRTTVGRTPENDIMLDTGFISRHHAVLLASSRYTIVEDLNSTNGVRVNGRRVTRQVLHDGDVVTIGKTDFRYQLRPAARPD